MRWLWARLGACENVPSIDTVWRGPVGKIQVMLSVRPSGWHEPQLLQLSFDHRPRAVK